MSQWINMETIEQLRELGDENEDFLGEMVRLYISNSEAKISTLPALLRESKFQEIKALCHQLKASSGNIGATALQEACANLEKNAEQRNQAAMEKDCAIIVDLFPKVSAELRAILEKKS